MRILGIDPGLQTTGFGVIDADGPRLHYVASGTIKTAEVARGDLPARLKIIFDGVCEVAQRYEAHCAAVEIVFVNVNPQSTLLLGQARGAALAALVSRSLAVSEYTALQMKKAIVGSGHAHKTQVQAMVQRLLALQRGARARRGRRAGHRHHPCPCRRVAGGAGRGHAAGAAPACTVPARARLLTTCARSPRKQQRATNRFRPSATARPEAQASRPVMPSHWAPDCGAHWPATRSVQGSTPEARRGS